MCLLLEKLERKKEKRRVEEKEEQRSILEKMEKRLEDDEKQKYSG